MKYPVNDSQDNRKVYCHEKRRYRKLWDDFIREEHHEAINNERKEAKREEVNRDRDEHEHWANGVVDNRQDKCCKKSHPSR